MDISPGWWVNAVPRKVCVCNVMKSKSGASVFHEMHEWEWMRWNIAPSVSVALSSLFPLVLPSAVSPPPLLCQFACPGQMILDCTTAAAKTDKRKWHLFKSIVRCKWRRRCVCVYRRPHTERYQQITKKCSLSFEILSASCGGHLVTASGQRYCVCVFVWWVCDQGTCCKIAGKWHPFKHKGPASGLLLFAFTHTHTEKTPLTHPPSQSMRLLIGSRVLPPFVSVCMWTCPCGVRQRSLSQRTMIHAV